MTGREWDRDKDPPVDFHGADGDFIYLSTPSSSGAVNEDGSPKWYDVTVCKRDGIITCSCPDAEYRAKFGLVNDPRRGHTCIHIRRAMEKIEAALKDPPPQREGRGSDEDKDQRAPT